MGKFSFFYIAFFLFCNLFCHSQISNDSIKQHQKYAFVSGIVTYTSTYFGGVPPSPAMIEELARPKPATNFALYIKLGSINTEQSKIYKMVRTDDSGRFSVQLKIGQVYCFVNKNKARPLIIPPNDRYADWNIDCLKQEYAKPDYVIHVKAKENSQIRINYHDDHYQPCNRLPMLMPP